MAKSLKRKKSARKSLIVIQRAKLQGQQTLKIQVNSSKRTVCIQVSNYPFDICKFSALFLTELQGLKRAKFATNLKGLNLFSATYLSPLSLTSNIILSFIQDLF